MQEERFTWKEIFKGALILFVILSVISLPFYYVRGAGYNYTQTLSKKKRVAAEPSNTIDVLFVGDSEAWSAYGPLQFYHEEGFTSYNIATPGQWIGDSLSIIKYTLQTQSPKVLVFGANTLYNAVPKKSYLLSQMIPLFHYHEYLINYLSSVSSIDQNKGANLSLVVNAYKGTADYMNASTELKTIDDMNLKIFSEIYQLCIENDIQMVVVAAPSAMNWTTGKHLAVEQWCEENSVDFIDYNDSDKQAEIAFDWSTDTRDKGDHVNASGSIKVDRNLGPILKDKYALPDHRNDSSFQSWEDNYQNSRYYKQGDGKK